MTIYSIIPKNVDSYGDDNIHNVQITCLERDFIARVPIGGPDEPFDRIKIESQIASRMNYNSYPDQGRTSLCGPLRMEMGVGISPSIFLEGWFLNQ